MDEAIDRAIVELVRHGRVSSVSVLVNSPLWSKDAGVLAKAAENRADVGLHLDLTQNFGGYFQSHKRLVLRSVLGLLDSKQIEERVNHQLDLFESAYGRRPDFVDGHQHIHQLPVIRGILLKTLKRRYPTQLPWLRSTRPAQGELVLKAWIIYLLGGRALERSVSRSDFITNTAFAGVYGFGGSPESWRARVRNWLSKLPERGLLHVHPADALVAGDPIAVARVKEYEIIRSKFFGDLLQEMDIEVGRLSGQIGS